MNTSPAIPATDSYRQRMLANLAHLQTYIGGLPEWVDVLHFTADIDQEAITVWIDWPSFRRLFTANARKLAGRDWRCVAQQSPLIHVIATEER